MVALPVAKMTLADFLEWENAQPDRHELVQGEVFSMVGAKRSHVFVVGNLMRELGMHLKGGPCRPVSESGKLELGDETVVYPDLFVTCDRADLRSDMVFRSPILVVEVLSPSTAAYDKGRKFALYRTLPSLREFVLIDPDTRAVETFRRNTSGEWVLHDFTGSDALLLPCIDASVSMADLFDGLDPSEP